MPNILHLKLNVQQSLFCNCILIWSHNLRINLKSDSESCKFRGMWPYSKLPINFTLFHLSITSICELHEVGIESKLCSSTKCVQGVLPYLGLLICNIEEIKEFPICLVFIILLCHCDQTQSKKQLSQASGIHFNMVMKQLVAGYAFGTLPSYIILKEQEAETGQVVGSDNKTRPL